MASSSLMRRPVWLLLFCCLAADASHARDIFVNNVSGSDLFDGRDATARNRSGPCQTIGKALRLAGKGDRIVIANTGQPYHECLSVQAGPHSGLPGEPFTIGHEAGWRPYLPLVDDLISVLDENSSSKPLKVITSEGTKYG